MSSPKGNEARTSPSNEVFNQPDRTNKSTSKFYSKGVLLKTIQYDNRDIIRKIVYHYDNNGNLTEENSFTKTGKLEFKQSYKYTYDFKLNWIKKIVCWQY